MKRFPPVVGQIGTGIAIAGAVLAWVAHLITSTGVLMILVMAGSFIYLTGAFMMVGALGYQRGGKAVLVTRRLRVSIALSMAWAVVRIVSSP